MDHTSQLSGVTQLMNDAAKVLLSGCGRMKAHRRLLAACILLAWTASLCGQKMVPSGDPRFQIADEVYRNLAQAAGISVKPVFVMKAECCMGAYFTSNPATRKDVEGRVPIIVLEEDIYDVCAGFAKDLRNCLAVVLGHELAHYSKDHDFLDNFARAYTQLQISKEMAETGVPRTPEDRKFANERNRYLETQADYYGGMYGYMTGYKTLNLAPRVVDAIYDKFHLKDHPLAGYPSLDDRKRMAQESQRRLALMAKIFNAANWLVLLNHFEEAVACYDYLLQDFQSPELYNNAAAARVLQTLSKFGQMKFALPLELDARSRLTAASRGQNKGLDGRDRLLKEAMGLLLEAQRRDSEYATALVNTASVYLLQGDWPYAAATADRALRVATQTHDSVTMANALLVRGIAHFFNGEPEKALADFEKASSGNPVMAEVNIALVRDPEHATAAFKRPAERLSSQKEKIGAVPSDALSTAIAAAQVPLLVLPAAGERAEVILVTQETAEWTAYKVLGESEIDLVTTSRNYAGRTVRGVAVGGTVAEVKEKYGEPASVAAGRQGVYMVYQDAPIIFHVNEAQRVDEWSLYTVR